jgi:ribonuclease VapC
MVIDTSALLALLLDEPQAQWVADRLDENAGSLQMSTVNLAEALIRVRDLRPGLFSGFEARVLGMGIQFVPPSVAQAQIAAEARMRFPINLGDCFAYALAVSETTALLALDSDFRKTDVDLVAPAT